MGNVIDTSHQAKVKEAKTGNGNVDGVKNEDGEWVKARSTATQIRSENQPDNCELASGG